MSPYIAIIAVLLGAAAALYITMGSSTEGFWNLPSRTWKVEKAQREDTPYGLDFVSTPGFQSLLSPRFSNVNYGSYLRTKFPEYEMMGVPSDPLGGDFGGSFNAADSGPKVVDGFSTKENYHETPSYLNADGELKQPIIYDRFVYANRHSRLRARGDYIRGDLPIVPNSGNWFTPSVHPNIDLNAGAINVMAGVNNETSNELASLIYNSSGGGDTTIGGVDMRTGLNKMNMTTQNRMSTVNAGGDVIVTSFP